MVASFHTLFQNHLRWDRMFCMQAQTANFLTFLAVLGRRGGPRGEKMAVACRGADSQVLATILDPFGPIFVDLVGPDGLSEA